MNNFGYTIVTSFILRLSLSQVGHTHVENLLKRKKGKSGKATVAINHIKTLYAVEALDKQQRAAEETLKI